MTKTAFVYILANKKNGVLYTGVTNNLERRLYEHRHHLLKGFTSQYGVTRLVWFTQGEDIASAIDLEKKIRLFQEGKIDPDKFRSLRLARGIYGQRQSGVQMIRIKLPLGRVTTQQLRRIADISDEYASKNLHATTRQDIQIHFVSLDKTPELWAKLEKDNITTREACGNTVRNITTSPTAR